MSLVLSGTLLSSKSFSKSIFLKSELDSNSSLSGNQNKRTENCFFYEGICLENQEKKGVKKDSSLTDKNVEPSFSIEIEKQSIASENEKNSLVAKVDNSFVLPKSFDINTTEKNFIASKNKEIELIAKTIWGEGRGESYEGKVAIGNVIINRYKLSQATKKPHWWGNTIEQIIFHPYQFSCHNHNDPNKSKIAKLTTEDYQYRESLKIARGILSGTIKDNTFGATHYFAYKVVKPRWASKMKKTKRVGNHDFYKK